MREKNREALERLSEAEAKGQESKRIKARQPIKGQVDKGKDKADEDHLPKAKVSKLSKSQVQRVMARAEIEHEAYMELAREMQVPSDLVLHTAHRQIARPRGSLWNDWQCLYAYKHPQHGQ
jgi:hypothetical protein